MNWRRKEFGPIADNPDSKITLFDGEKVSVVAGGQEFKLPKALLCYHSSYFDSAFNRGFLETSEKHLILSSDHTAETFKLVIQYIYIGDITIPDRLLEATTKFVASLEHLELELEPDIKNTNADIVTGANLQKELLNIRKDHVSVYIAF